MLNTLTSALFLSFLICTSLPANTQGGGAGPLPPPPVPAQNPITPQKAVLGKILFWEEQLSSDNTVSCGTCHGVPTGFTDARIETHHGIDEIFGTPDDVLASPGMIHTNDSGEYFSDEAFRLNPQVTSRRTPDIFGALYANETFWDGRGTSVFTDPETGLVVIPLGGALESQSLGPILSNVEMAQDNREWAHVVAKLQRSRPLSLANDLTPDIRLALEANPSYGELFQNAFGTNDITAQRIAYAIATYERTLVPNQSPWDAFQAGDQSALTTNQRAGLDQFNGAANCSICHTPPFFTDNRFHNLGLRPNIEDAGRQAVTSNFFDRGKFKTPSLRNAGLRRSFFHNGQASVLFNGVAAGGVDDIYIAGGGPFRDNLDPLIVPLLGRPNIDMAQIMDFVGNGLTDPRVAASLPPFDKPTLFSERHPFGADSFGPANPGGNGITPRLITHTPASFGDSAFKVGLFDAPRDAATATLGISLSSGSGTIIGGVPFNLGGPVSLWQTAPLQPDFTGRGYTTFQLNIPTLTSLIDIDFFVQAFIEDQSAPGGVAAATRGTVYHTQ